ncbi:MAG: heme o synthase [Candidatus Sulfotelmatobacter sp.]
MATQLTSRPLKAQPSLTSQLSDYYALTKPEVNLLVVIATAAGYVLASSGNVNWARLICVLIGTLLVASGTATLNQVMEKVHDARMRRTARRPLPDGRLRSWEAAVFGILLSVAGTLELLVLVNWQSAALALATLLSYLFIYTPLKRKTALCTLLGAIPGAMPILIGWTGASAIIDLRAALLFAILFLWQFPHFLSIALLYREDYERAGYRMLPVRDREGRYTRAEIVGFTVLLTAVTLICASAQGRSIASLLVMLGAGVFLLFQSIRLAGNGSKMAAGRLLHASVIYLPVVLAVLIAQKY